MADRTLVVLTQNAWGGAAHWSLRKQTLARAIEILRPDVVGLQEVHVAPGAPDDASQAHELAALVPAYRAQFAAGRIDADGHREGVALLTHAALSCVATSTEKLTLDHADPLEGVSQRVVLHARVLADVLADPIDLFVTHLSLSLAARSRTTSELLSFIARTREGSASHGAVLMGDLNATPDEEGIARIGEHWIDAWQSEHPGRRGGTWPALVPFKRLDYVFVPKQGRLVVETCHRLPYAGSDHRGLVAHLRPRSSAPPRSPAP